jgi:hypothetical protein
VVHKAFFGAFDQICQWVPDIAGVRPALQLSIHYKYRLCPLVSWVLFVFSLQRVSSFLPYSMLLCRKSWIQCVDSHSCLTQSPQTLVSSSIREMQAYNEYNYLDQWAEYVPDNDVWSTLLGENSFDSASQGIGSSLSLHHRSLSDLRVDEATSPNPSVSLDGDPPLTPLGFHNISESSDNCATITRCIGSAWVIFGPGCSIESVTTEAESPWVEISLLPSYTCAEDMMPVLSSFGEVLRLQVRSTKHSQQSSSVAHVCFSGHAQARAAVLALHGYSSASQPMPLTARIDPERSVILDSSPASPISNESRGLLHFETQSARDGVHYFVKVEDRTVKVTWRAPRNTAYVTYRTAGFASRCVKDLNGRTFQGRRLTVAPVDPIIGPNSQRIARENGGFVVRFENLSPNCRTAAFSEYARSQDVVISSQYNLEQWVSRLREYLSDVGPVESFRLLNEKSHDEKLHALVEYASLEAASAAVSIFDGTSSFPLGPSPVRVFPRLKISYSLNSKLATAMRPVINKLHSWANDDPYNLFVRESDSRHQPDFLELSILGDDIKLIAQAKAALDRALSGEIICDADGIAVWDPFFATEGGAKFLDEVGASNDVYLRADRRNRSLVVYGAGYSRDTARSAIMQRFDNVSLLQSTTQKTELFPNSVAGSGREGIQEAAPEMNLISGTSSLLRTELDHHDRIADEHGVTAALLTQVPSEKRCVVCFHYPQAPILLRCGHFYCRECFLRYTTSATANLDFPLLCIGEGCRDDLPLWSIQKFVPRLQLDLLLVAAFHRHILSHPDALQFCPSPDCGFVYRTSQDGKSVQCKVCLTHICTTCCVPQHLRLSCMEYRAAHVHDDIQKSFDRWRLENNVKDCPKCRAPIQKMSGCNHMVCAVCCSHLCWLCMLSFQTAELVYVHMRSEHGGIGL